MVLDDEIAAVECNEDGNEGLAEKERLVSGVAVIKGATGDEFEEFSGLWSQGTHRRQNKRDELATLLLRHKGLSTPLKLIQITQTHIASWELCASDWLPMRSVRRNNSIFAQHQTHLQR
jgi:hypothetical protein